MQLVTEFHALVLNDFLDCCICLYKLGVGDDARKRKKFLHLSCVCSTRHDSLFTRVRVMGMVRVIKVFLKVQRRREFVFYVKKLVTW